MKPTIHIVPMSGMQGSIPTQVMGGPKIYVAVLRVGGKTVSYVPLASTRNQAEKVGQDLLNTYTKRAEAARR